MLAAELRPGTSPSVLSLEVGIFARLPSLIVGVFLVFHLFSSRRLSHSCDLRNLCPGFHL